MNSKGFGPKSGKGQKWRRRKQKTYATNYNLPRRAPSSDRVFAFIVAEIESGIGFPGEPMIVRHMGWKNEESARIALKNLYGDGRLMRLFAPGSRKAVYRLPNSDERADTASRSDKDSA